MEQLSEVKHPINPYANLSNEHLTDELYATMNQLHLIQKEIIKKLERIKE